jgi:uncharacterized protein (TIGR02271 family)
MAQTVIGIFNNPNTAQSAVEQLASAGISPDRIDIANCNTTDTHTSTSTDHYSTTTDPYKDDDDDSIGGFFRSLFGGDDDNDYRKYSTVARRGCVVTVHAQSDEEARRTADLLDDLGAVDVDEQAANYGYTGQTGTTGTMGTTSSTLATGSGIAGMPNPTATGTTDSDYTRTNLNTDRLDTDRLDTDRSIPIIEEKLQVGKREVETGGVRVRSRIIERPVEEHLRLRQERVNVVRNPVNRPANSADLDTFREGMIEMTEHAEVPVVNKEARVVEEITLGKEVTERDEVVHDTVRKTEVDVENLGTSNVRQDLENTTGLDLDNDQRRTDLDLDNDRRRTDLDGDRSTAL